MNKVVVNAQEACKGIEDNMTLMLGGFGLCGIPENSISELVNKLTELRINNQPQALASILNTHVGTIPMLFVLTNGFGMFSMSIRSKFRKLLPYVTLCFGIFLIYRGFAVNMPLDLNFWEALKNPVLCH